MEVGPRLRAGRIAEVRSLTRTVGLRDDSRRNGWLTLLIAPDIPIEVGAGPEEPPRLDGFEWAAIRAEADPVSRPRRPLYLSRDADYDYLTALEIGRVDDGQAPELWLEISEEFRFLLSKPGGRPVGFRIDEFSEWLPTDEEEHAIRAGGRFDAPLVVLRGAGALRIASEAKRFFGEESSLNRSFFDRATECGTNEEYEQELYWWRCCLEAGDPWRTSVLATRSAISAATGRLCRTCATTRGSLPTDPGAGSGLAGVRAVSAALRRPGIRSARRSNSAQTAPRRRTRPISWKRIDGSDQRRGCQEVHPDACPSWGASWGSRTPD